MSKVEVIKNPSALIVKNCKDYQKRKQGKRIALCFKATDNLTDQSQKKKCDINNILKIYQKTGVMPHVKEGLAQYLDVSEVPNLEEAHEIIKEANALFMELPADVRRLCDNNPEKLHDVLVNENYQDLLLSYGILEKQDVANVSSIEGNTGAESSGTGAEGGVVSSAESSGASEA